MSLCKNILLVDDDPNIAEILKDGMQRKFNAVEQVLDFYQAADGEAALALAHDILPAVIIMEVCLPVIDGIDVVAELRKDAKFDACVILLLSCDITAEVEGLTTGADDYINKPFNINAILIRIEHALYTAQQRAYMNHDPVTGLWQRGYIESNALDEHMTQWQKQHQPCMSLMLVEFHTHSEILTPDQEMKILQACLSHRVSDIVVRWQNNTFAVLLPATASDGAILIADKLTQQLHQQYPLLTMAIGIAHGNDIASDTLVNFAENSLAAAHHSGVLTLNGQPVIAHHVKH